MPDNVIGNESRTTPWADPSTGSPDKNFPSPVATGSKEVPHHNGQTLGVQRLEPTLHGGLGSNGGQRYQPNDRSPQAPN